MLRAELRACYRCRSYLAATCCASRSISSTTGAPKLERSGGSKAWPCFFAVSAHFNTRKNVLDSMQLVMRCTSGLEWTHLLLLYAGFI